MRQKSGFSNIAVLLLAFLSLTNPSRCIETDSLRQTGRQTIFTDAEITEVVYGRKTYPPNFHCEDFRGGTPYYVSKWSLHSPYGRTGSTAPLCTMDPGQARIWALTLDSNSSVHRSIVEERETDKYFEIRMINPLNDRDILLVRVDKCSYLNRSIAAYHSTAGSMSPDSTAVDTLGVLVRRPISVADVSELVEHHWYEAWFNWEGSCVMSSFSNEGNESITQVIYSTNLNTGDYDMYDEIFLIKEVYTVVKRTGLITRSMLRVKTVQGRFHEMPTH
jgi:hypothetical protein